MSFKTCVLPSKPYNKKHLWLILTSLRPYDREVHHQDKTKFCATCRDLITVEALFNVGNGKQRPLLLGVLSLSHLISLTGLTEITIRNGLKDILTSFRLMKVEPIMAKVGPITDSFITAFYVISCAR